MDPVTGAVDETAWSLMLSSEKDRCRRYGVAASVISIEWPLTGGGTDRADEATLERVMDVALGTTRLSDVVARLGVNRVGVLAVHADEVQGRVVRDRLAQLYADQRLAVSITIAQLREAGEGGAPTAEQVVDPSQPKREGPITSYEYCGNCHRKGAYVVPSMPVLRCKYCRARRTLSVEQWRDATATLARLGAHLGRSDDG